MKPAAKILAKSGFSHTLKRGVRRVYYSPRALYQLSLKDLDVAVIAVAALSVDESVEILTDSNGKLRGWKYQEA